MEPANAPSLRFGPRWRTALSHLAVFAGYVVASVALTWPLSLRMRDHVLAAKWHHDAYTNTMILATRVLNALGEGAGGTYENFFFAPIPQTIVFNENLFGLSLLYAPFYLASGNPLLAYNQVLILSLALSGYGAYLLVAHLTGSRPAAFLSGLAFAFCPYATFEIGRIQLVATAWIPLSFLCLQLAMERGRARYSLLFALSYAMQVGTCLYYAMFLLPLLAVHAVWLATRHRRTELVFWLQTALSGALCAALLVAMIWPYFATRDDFALKRSEAFARGYDGEIPFLAHVHTDNRLLKPLRHASKDHGAHEEVAFPTFTMSSLALFALALPLSRGLRWRRRGAREAVEPREAASPVLPFLVVTVLTAGAAIGASIWFRSALAGLPIVVCGVAYFRWTAEGPSLFSNDLRLYLILLMLSVVLFLGLEPLEVDGASMRGLYYYLHTYVPGFNGIRKVSRQAIVVMMMVAIVGGYGAAELLTRWSRRRALITGGLCLVLLAEVACVPMRLVSVPAETTVPKVYEWLAKRRTQQPIAVLPTNDGVRRFKGMPGVAMHNYLTLYHRHRTINGKSSWIPPVTHLFHDVTRDFPTPDAKRLLQTLGVEHVVIHTGDMPPRVGDTMIAALDRDTQNYERVFRDNADLVYRLKPAPGDQPTLLETPPLPAGAERVHRWSVKATASRMAQDAALALDERTVTRWSTHGPQVPGDFFELTIPRAQELAAVELASPEGAFEVPAAYDISVANGEGPFRVVVHRPTPELYRDQVLQPRAFVFRVNLPKGTVADRVRITVLHAFAHTPWTIQEASVWVKR